MSKPQSTLKRSMWQPATRLGGRSGNCRGGGGRTSQHGSAQPLKPSKAPRWQKGGSGLLPAVGCGHRPAETGEALPSSRVSKAPTMHMCGGHAHVLRTWRALPGPGILAIGAWVASCLKPPSSALCIKSLLQRLCIGFARLSLCLLNLLVASPCVC